MSVADASKIIYNNQTMGATNFWKETNLFISPKSSLNILENSVNLMVQMKAKTIWKIRRFNLHFCKEINAKSCLIPDIIHYSLAWKLKQQDIFGFWMTFLLFFPSEKKREKKEKKFKPKVFRTEMYKIISVNKFSIFRGWRSIQKHYPVVELFNYQKIMKMDLTKYA